MKNSTKAGAGAGVATAALGIGLAFLCPAAGLVAGAYFTYGALATAGFGTAATVALTAAGGFGGLLLGKIAKPLVMLAAVGLGAAAGATVKLFGSLFEDTDSGRPARARQPSGPQPSAAQVSGSVKKQSGLAAIFRTGGASNENVTPAQNNRKLPAPKP